MVRGQPATDLRAAPNAITAEAARDHDATSVKLLGQRLSARDFDRQVAEFQVRVAVLNGFAALGTPITEVTG
jgi:hypothetical protein